MASSFFLGGAAFDLGGDLFGGPVAGGDMWEVGNRCGIRLPTKLP